MGIVQLVECTCEVQFCPNLITGEQSPDIIIRDSELGCTDDRRGGMRRHLERPPLECVQAHVQCHTQIVLQEFVKVRNGVCAVRSYSS